MSMPPEDAAREAIGVDPHIRGKHRHYKDAVSLLESLPRGAMAFLSSHSTKPPALL
jgi:hypothetical protein